MMTQRSRLTLFRPAALAPALLLMAACAASPSGPCGQTTVELQVTVIEDAMTPSALEACRDIPVSLEITSEVDGEFHIHGIEGEVEAELSASDTETLTLEFTPTVAGQFIIEVHPEDGEEFEAGVLTVNEP
jgi:hypothetical protein